MVSVEALKMGFWTVAPKGASTVASAFLGGTRCASFTFVRVTLSEEALGSLFLAQAKAAAAAAAMIGCVC